MHVVLAQAYAALRQVYVAQVLAYVVVQREHVAREQAYVAVQPVPVVLVQVYAVVVQEHAVQVQAYVVAQHLSVAQVCVLLHRDGDAQWMVHAPLYSTHRFLDRFDVDDAVFGVVCVAAVGVVVLLAVDYVVHVSAAMVADAARYAHVVVDVLAA